MVNQANLGCSGRALLTGLLDRKNATLVVHSVVTGANTDNSIHVAAYSSEQLTKNETQTDSTYLSRWSLWHSSAQRLHTCLGVSAQHVRQRNRVCGRFALLNAAEHTERGATVTTQSAFDDVHMTKSEWHTWHGFGEHKRLAHIVGCVATGAHNVVSVLGGQRVALVANKCTACLRYETRTSERRKRARVCVPSHMPPGCITPHVRQW